MISIILASGQGTRMRPLSYYIPKVLLPVRGKPVLDYILANLKGLDIDTHYVVVSEHLETVEKYIQKTGLDAHVALVRGLEWESGGDLAIAFEHINPTGDVAVMNGDIVTDIDMSKVYNDHLKRRGLVTMAVTDVVPERAKALGRVNFEPETGKVLKFLEKASDGPNTINAGFYIFDRRFVSQRKDYLPLRKFKYEPELFPRLVTEGILFASRQDAKYFWDVGTFDSYMKAEVGC